MPAINYDHQPNDVIWVITDCGTNTFAVEKASVNTVEIDIQNDFVENIYYNVAILTPAKGGVAKVKSTEAFANKADAITDYETRVLD